MRKVVAAGLAAVAVAVAGCGGSDDTVAETTAALPCPAAWAAGWQQLADEAGADVFCPRWMPSPLDGEIGGAYKNTTDVSVDGSYLVSFLYVEREAGGVADEVHVNFRGYPGSTAIPACEDARTDDGVTTRVEIPCFSDERGTKQIGGREVTVYTVNQGIDQWHVLYAWEHDDGLYTVSQHVIGAHTLARVTGNLDRIMRTLVRVPPTAA